MGRPCRALLRHRGGHISIGARLNFNVLTAWTRWTLSFYKPSGDLPSIPGGGSSILLRPCDYT